MTIINGIIATNPSSNRAGIIKNQALLFIDFSTAINASVSSGYRDKTMRTFFFIRVSKEAAFVHAIDVFN